MSQIKNDLIKEQLEKELRTIYDDNDFVFCTFNGLNDTSAEKMLMFINTARDLREKVTYEDIVGLSLILEKEG